MLLITYLYGFDVYPENIAEWIDRVLSSVLPEYAEVHAAIAPVLNEGWMA